MNKILISNSQVINKYKLNNHALLIRKIKYKKVTIFLYAR